MLSGSIVSRSGEYAEVALACGYQGPARLPAGEKDLEGEITVAVRPESLALSPEPVAGAVPGTVSAISYFGSGCDYEIALENGELLTLRLQNRHTELHPGGVGVSVSLVIGRESLQVLAD